MKEAIQDLSVNEQLQAVEANLEKVYGLLRDAISIAEHAFYEEKNKSKRNLIDIVIYEMASAQNKVDKTINHFKNI
jgi:hypothetical protein